MDARHDALQARCLELEASNKYLGERWRGQSVIILEQAAHIARLEAWIRDYYENIPEMTPKEAREALEAIKRGD